MLFSRIEARPNARKIEIDSTEIGMLAATVRPARRPTYTVTAPKMIPKIAPRISARAESSLGLSSADTKGLKVVVDVAIRENLLANKLKLRQRLHRSVPVQPLGKLSRFLADCFGYRTRIVRPCRVTMASRSLPRIRLACTFA